MTKRKIAPGLFTLIVGMMLVVGLSVWNYHEARLINLANGDIKVMKKLGHLRVSSQIEPASYSSQLPTNWFAGKHDRWVLFSDFYKYRFPKDRSRITPSLVKRIEELQHFIQIGFSMGNFSDELKINIVNSFLLNFSINDLINCQNISSNTAELGVVYYSEARPFGVPPDSFILNSSNLPVSLEEFTLSLYEFRKRLKKGISPK